MVTSELHGSARATALAHVSNVQKAVENRRKPTTGNLTTPERWVDAVPRGNQSVDTLVNNVGRVRFFTWAMVVAFKANERAEWDAMQERATEVRAPTLAAVQLTTPMSTRSTRACAEPWISRMCVILQPRPVMRAVVKCLTSGHTSPFGGGGSHLAHMV